MMVARESGCRTLSDFWEMDGAEYRAWARFVLGGASEMRTQMLLAQLIQMVGGALGGRPTPLNKLLPYHDEITGANTPRARKARHDRKVAYHQSLVDDLIRKHKEG